MNANKELEKLGLSITSKFKGVKIKDGWKHVAFDCTLCYGGRRLRVTFRLGVGRIKSARPNESLIALTRLAHKQGISPDLSELIYSLLCDTDSIEDGFTDWCENFGLDDDSIKNLNMFKACERVKSDLDAIDFPYEAAREILQDY